MRPVCRPPLPFILPIIYPGHNTSPFLSHSNFFLLPSHVCAGVMKPFLLSFTESTPPYIIRLLEKQKKIHNFPSKFIEDWPVFTLYFIYRVRQANFLFYMNIKKYFSYSLHMLHCWCSSSSLDASTVKVTIPHTAVLQYIYLTPFWNPLFWLSILKLRGHLPSEDCPVLLQISWTDSQFGKEGRIWAPHIAINTTDISWLTTYFVRGTDVIFVQLRWYLHRLLTAL
jgi:hypothetical protein